MAITLLFAACAAPKGGVVTHTGRCCAAARAEAPKVDDLEEAACTGTRWSTVYPGECRVRQQGTCTTGLTTRVTVKEYRLRWDVFVVTSTVEPGQPPPKPSGTCKADETANTSSVQAAQCSGDNCRRVEWF